MGPGPLIAEARRKAGIRSQFELARRSGVAHSVINRLESDPNAGATTDVLQRLASAIGIPASSLMPNDVQEKRLLPRTVSAIPSDAPAHKVEAFDKEVSDLAKLIFGESVSGRPKRRAGGGESGGQEGDEGAPVAGGFFNMNNLPPLGQSVYPGKSPLCSLMR